jgi:hypothetical protein
MSEQDFHNDVIDRLARIETKQTSIDDQLKSRNNDLDEIGVIAREARQSAKSAHHRIDSMYVVATLIAGIVSWFLTYLKGLWSN